MITPEEFIAVIDREKDLLLRIRKQWGVLAAVEVLRREIPFLSSADLSAIVEGFPDRLSPEGLRYLALRECTSPNRTAWALQKQFPRSGFTTIRKAVEALPNESRLNAMRAVAKRSLRQRGGLV